MPEDFKMLRRPGFAIGAMNFRLDDTGSGMTAITTETAFMHGLVIAAEIRAVLAAHVSREC
jgi:hypothetical protein